MAYFKVFPTIEYEGLTVVDIMRKIVIEPEVINNTTMWSTYTIKDGELPEDIAHNFYGSSERIDIVLLMNQIIDPFYGWVLSFSEFEAFLNNKYGSNVNGIHHYEKDGEVVQAGTQDAITITNYGYEFEKNEKKRNIKILNSVYLSAMLDEMTTKLHNNTRDKQTWQ